MSPPPSAETLALLGIASIAVFALWKVQVAPRLARRLGPAPNV